MAVRDPASKQPQLKLCRARVDPDPRRRPHDPEVRDVVQQPDPGRRELVAVRGVDLYSQRVLIDLEQALGVARGVLDAP